MEKWDWDHNELEYTGVMNPLPDLIDQVSTLSVLQVYVFIPTYTLPKLSKLCLGRLLM